MLWPIAHFWGETMARVETRRFDRAGAGAGKVTLEYVALAAWSRATRRRTVLHGRADIESFAERGDSSCVWLEMKVAGDDDGWYSRNTRPWDESDRPRVDWHGVEKAIDNLRNAEPQLPTDELDRVLMVLPHLYELGLPRAYRELYRSGDPPKGTRMFPTLGFVPAPLDGDDGLAFWGIRMNVAVVDNVVLTVVLPELVCHASTGAAPSKTSPVGFKVPDRFLPVTGAVEANDIAGSIALYQSATTRAVADAARERLESLESAAFDRIQRAGDAVDDEATAAALVREFRDVSEVVQKVDQELGRLLRRLGSFDRAGTTTTPADTADLTSGEVRVRYRYALDEIRSLQTELRLASEVMTSLLATRHLEISKQQQDIARKQQEISNEQQRRSQRLERVAAALASVLAPLTIVIAIYGANVDLPGHGVEVPGPKDLRGFGAMLSFGLASVTATFTAVGRLMLENLSRRTTRGLIAVAILATLLGVLLSL